jgi:hypothetical protein
MIAPKIPRWIWLLVALVVLFPPYVQVGRQSHFDVETGAVSYGPEVRGAAGWRFIGALQGNQQIRWEILALEVSVILIVGLGFGMDRRPTQRTTPTAAMESLSEPPLLSQAVKRPLSRNPWANLTKSERIWAVLLCWLIPLSTALLKRDTREAIAAFLATLILGVLAWLIGVPVFRAFRRDSGSR